MDMARTKPLSSDFAKTAFPRKARITETSSNDYIDMSKMSKVLNFFHEQNDQAFQVVYVLELKKAKECLMVKHLKVAKKNILN